MRNRVLFVCVLVFWLCGAGCQTPSKKPVAVAKPVEVPPSRILTLSQQQLVSLDWHTPTRPGPRVRAKTVVAGPAVEFDIYFPSNSPGNHSLTFVSSGEGGRGTLVGADIRGYETFALKLTLVSINGQSEPELKQKVVAGAVIGPTATHQISTYGPITLGLAASEKTAIAKTPGLADRIYQIGFHVHMLNPENWDPSGSMIKLRVEPVEHAHVPSAPPAAAVAIDVGPNRSPVAEPRSVSTMEDAPMQISLTGSDPDSDPLAYSTLAGPSHGSLSGTEPNLTYTPDTDFNGSDSFTFKVNDGTTDSVPATVSITVSPVNDPPVITSAPVITATAAALYTYDVEAADPDVGDTLTYSLTTKPVGMTIHSATGLIQWKPTNAQGRTNQVVVVKVTDSSSIPAVGTQSFTITVNPAPPKTATLTVLDGYDQRNRRTLSTDGKTSIVQSSDNNRLETYSGSYTSYDFSDALIPADAVITSVVVYVEHFEEERFARGKLQWTIGTGWPTKPVVWASIAAPVYKGQSRESVDSWDITSIADTREKLNSLQLQVKNNDNVAYRKTLMDYIYIEVEFLD